MEVTRRLCLVGKGVAIRLVDGLSLGRAQAYTQELIFRNQL